LLVKSGHFKALSGFDGTKTGLFKVMASGKILGHNAKL